MFTRFNGNVVPFADDATSTNRTVFGETTQSDLIDDNLNTNFKKGWEIVGLNDNPTREDFNAMGFTLGALTAYLYEMGISEWNASQNYRANSRVTGSDGKIYKSLTGTTGIPNVGNNPTTDAVNWQAENITDYSSLTNKTTPVDADLIAIADSTSSFSLKKLSWVNLKATLKTYFDTLYLNLTGNQTIAGVKTFSSSPIVPTPINNGDAANKNYADLKVALTAFTGSNQSLSGNGYQKLPEGLIIQWGATASTTATYTDVIFPLTFPSGVFSVQTTKDVLVVDTTGSTTPSGTKSVTNRGFTFVYDPVSSSSMGDGYWFAIGK